MKNDSTIFSGYLLPKNVIENVFINFDEKDKKIASFVNKKWQKELQHWEEEWPRYIKKCKTIEYNQCVEFINLLAHRLLQNGFQIEYDKVLLREAKKDDEGDIDMYFSDHFDLLGLYDCKNLNEIKQFSYDYKLHIANRLKQSYKGALASVKDIFLSHLDLYSYHAISDTCSDGNSNTCSETFLKSIAAIPNPKQQIAALEQRLKFFISQNQIDEALKFVQKIKNIGHQSYCRMICIKALIERERFEDSITYARQTPSDPYTQPATFSRRARILQFCFECFLNKGLINESLSLMFEIEQIGGRLDHLRVQIVRALCHFRGVDEALKYINTTGGSKEFFSCARLESLISCLKNGIMPRSKKLSVNLLENEEQKKFVNFYLAYYIDQKQLSNVRKCILYHKSPAERSILFFNCATRLINNNQFNDAFQLASKQELGNAAFNLYSMIVDKYLKNETPKEALELVLKMDMNPHEKGPLFEKIITFYLANKNLDSALEVLADLHEPARSEQAIKCIELSLSLHDFAQAKKLCERLPETVTFKGWALIVAAHLNFNQLDEALIIAKNWLACSEIMTLLAAYLEKCEDNPDFESIELKIRRLFYFMPDTKSCYEASKIIEGAIVKRRRLNNAATQ
jgi:hypothetical protein